MISVEGTITIDRPAEEVFAFVVDQTNAIHWQQGLREVRRLTPGPIRVGTEHEFIRRFAGRTMVSRNRYLELEAGRSVRFGFGTRTDGISGEGAYRVDPLDDRSCVLTSRVTLVLRGVVRALAPLMRRSLVRDMARDDRTLKAVLEAGPSVSPADVPPRT